MKNKISQLIEYGHVVSISYADPRCAEGKPYLVATDHPVEGNDFFCGETLKEAVNIAYESIILDQ